MSVMRHRDGMNVVGMGTKRARRQAQSSGVEPLDSIVAPTGDQARSIRGPCDAEDPIRMGLNLVQELAGCRVPKPEPPHPVATCQSPTVRAERDGMDGDRID